MSACLVMLDEDFPAKGVANPFPASLKDLNFYRLLSRSLHGSWLLSDDI